MDETLDLIIEIDELYVSLKEEGHSPQAILTAMESFIEWTDECLIDEALE